MEKISWTDHVRYKEVLLRVKEQMNILLEIRKRKANLIGHILRRKCPLQRVTEGKIKGGTEITGRRGRRRRKLLDDLNLYPTARHIWCSLGTAHRTNAPYVLRCGHLNRCACVAINVYKL